MSDKKLSLPRLSRRNVLAVPLIVATVAAVPAPRADAAPAAPRPECLADLLGAV